jgi:hypothetical protein
VVPGPVEAWHRTGKHPVLGGVSAEIVWGAHTEPSNRTPYVEFFTWKSSDIQHSWRSQDMMIDRPGTYLDHTFGVAPGNPTSSQRLAAAAEPRAAAGPRSATTAEYLLVWEEARPVPGWNDDQSVYGMCVEVSLADGSVSSPTGLIEIAYDHQFAKTRPHVTYVEELGEYLVVWSDEERIKAPFLTEFNNVRGRYLRCGSEEVQARPPFWISVTPYWSGLPRVNTDGVEAFVVYEESVWGAWDQIVVQRVDGSGAVGAPVRLD